MSRHLQNACIVVYMLIGLLTSGYSFNADYEYRPDVPRFDETVANASVALISGVAWPVYWAAVSFRPFRPEAPEND